MQLDELGRTGSFVLDTPGGGGRRELIVTEADLAEREALDSSAAAAPLSGMGGVAVLTVHGGRDNVVPPSSAHRFAAVIPNHDLHIIKGAGHNFNGTKYVDEIALTIVAFAARNSATWWSAT